MPMKSDEQWQREEDAYALARAEEIKSDPDRLSKAKQAARKLLDEQKRKASSRLKVAGAQPSLGKSRGSSNAGNDGGVIDVSTLVGNN